MTDKTDLIEKAASIISCGNDYRWILDIYKAKKLQTLFIESDEAREYWRERDEDEPNVLLSTHIKRMKQEHKRFVEQACEAIEGIDGDNRVILKVEAQEAVRDKFK